MKEYLESLIRSDKTDTYKAAGVIDQNLAEWKEEMENKTNELIPVKDPITFSWYDITAQSIHEETEHPHRLMCWCSAGERQRNKMILKNVSGIAHPGELFVLMGSSGAGKTTLLNCVTFRNIRSLKITGLVRVNDTLVNQTELAGQSAYVQQDDLFVPCLTVKEHMIFQARLRMDSCYTYEDKLHRIEELLNQLSLTKCQNVVIGLPGVVKGISGGERKRLALASELLMNPSLLFCDEPTTGLDSFMALNVMQTLKTLAASGRTVICTVHQPSSELFELFDKICLMAEGRTAFLGTRSEADDFFTKLKAPCPLNFSPADYYIQILSIIPGKEDLCKKNVNCICDAFERSSGGIKLRKACRSTKYEPSGEQWEIKSSPISPYKVGWWEQFKAVFWRCWLGIRKNKKITRLKFLSYLSVTVLISALYYNQVLNTQGVRNICGALFLFLTNSTFKNLSGVIVTFCSELPLFLREHKNGMYRTDVYFLSKSLADIPWFSFLNAMFTGTCYIFIGMNPTVPRFLTAIGITLLVTYTVLGVGYILSVSTPSVHIAQQLIAATVTPFLILGGYFLDIRSIPYYLTWLSDLSWFKWANEALLINQWENVKNITCTDQLSDCMRNGMQVLEEYGVAGPDIGDELSESSKFTESFKLRTRSYTRWSPTEEGVTLSWSDVSVYTRLREKGKFKYKRIINGVNGAVKSGSLVALMGASGSGKSTLMMALAHRNSGDITVEGDILVNGRQLGDYMKYISGCMYQEDIFVGSLTVWEHMNIMSHLKLDRRFSSQDRQLRIHKILKDLGLFHCLYTRIGAIGSNKTLSGGEKKRLSFATELLTDPPILFCDEPTTGLDSYSAQNLVSMMNVMATGGKTILCTIHQPSSEIFAMFSQIILLAEGRIAYMGSRSGALNFFNSMGYPCPSAHNPADYFIRILATPHGFEENSKNVVKKICDNFSVSDYAKEVDVVVQYEFHMGRAGTFNEFEVRSKFKEARCLTKLYFLIYRWFLDILRDPTIQILGIMQKVGIGLMVGLCYSNVDPKTQDGIQAVQGMAFLLISENTFSPMYSVLETFPKDHALCIREYQSGLYALSTYYVSKILATVPGLLIEPIIYVLIAYWLAGLQSTLNAFFFTVLAAVLTMNVSCACGIFFSSAFDTSAMAMQYLIPFDCIMMVTCGIFINLSTLSAIISWTKYLSWMMYSYEVITIVQWQNVKNITCSPTSQDLPCLTDGEEVLEKFSFSKDNLTKNLFAMVFLCVAFYVIGFFCLWRKMQRK
ncbi:protein scarlet [Harmonia axyridis]|uniref:protein scarlet n=1 Tax=Harmonia axyridis TaxID=115357 RepID=UPI001E27506B|nr:protein scarlet [Harmonia axyridis]